MRDVLQLVGQRLERGGVAAGRVRERPGEQQIRQPRIAGEQRAVEVRADRAPDAAALRSRTRRRFRNPRRPARAARRPASSTRPSRMVLEAGQRLLALRARARSRAGRRRSCAARPPPSRAGTARRRAAASRRDRGSRARAAGSRRRRRAAQRRRRPTRAIAPASRGEVGRDQRLLAILAAADVEQVVRSAALELVADAHRVDRQLVTAQRRPARRARRCCRDRRRCSGTRGRGGRR